MGKNHQNFDFYKKAGFIVKNKSEKEIKYVFNGRFLSINHNKDIVINDKFS